MKNSSFSSGRIASHQNQQQSPSTAFNGRPSTAMTMVVEHVGCGNARRNAKINPQSGPINAGNSRRQVLATNFLLHNSITQMNGKQQMEIKKNSTKNLGVKKEREEEKEKVIVDPLDVEEMLWSRKIARSEIRAANMPPQRLRDMLERDLHLKKRKRAKPFLENENGRMENDGAESNIKLGQNQVEMDLLDWYGRDSLQITRKWADLSAEANAFRMRRQRETIIAELPHHHFEGEHPNFVTNRIRAQSIGSNGASTASANSAHSFRRPAAEREQRTPPAGSELLELCETMGEQKLDEIRVITRRKMRGKLLANLAMPTAEESNEFDQNGGGEAMENNNINLWSGQSRLSIQFKRLALIPALEPLFASVALYNIQKRQKLSEHFNLNSATLSLSKSTKRALFTLPAAEGDDPMNELVLVFRFEKGLAKGGLDSALEAYTTTTKRIQQQQEERPNIELNGVHRPNQFRQQIGLLAIPLARTVANTHFGGGNDQQNRATAGGPPRSFIDSFIQTNFVSDDEQPFSNSPIHHLAHQHSAPQYSAEDTISESISADRLSSSTIPPPQIRPSNSWARISAKQSQETLNNAIGHHHQKMPPANFNWANFLRNQPISVRANHFLRSEPISEAELFDWLGSNQQRQSREKIPLDCHFELELCQMEELANSGWRVVSPEFRLLNFTQVEDEKEEWMELLDGASSAQDLLPFPVTLRLVMPNTFDRHLCYIYPHSVNFSSRIGQKNARNICIRAEFFDGQMRRIQGFVNENGRKMDSINSSVQYHCKQPKFGGIEWKMLLPRNVEGMHLRFTFLHISCKQKDANTTNKSSQSQMMMETPIGYSWLPLHQAVEQNASISGDHHLPISLDPLPPAICYLSPHLQFPNIHWLDSHRPLFHLSIQLISTIQPEDQHLLSFLNNSHKFIQNAETISSTELAQSIQNLLKIRPEPMLAFLHVLLHQILAILANCSTTAEFVQISAFDILCQLAKIGTMLLDGRTDKWGRSKILVDFIREEAMPKRQNKINENGNLEGSNGQTMMASNQKDRQNNNNGIDKTMTTKNGTESVANNQTKTTTISPIHLHEQLAGMLLHAIGQSQGNNTARDTVCTFCWFPLALIRRAMTEHLIQTEGQLLPRKMRFSPKFIENLGQIGELLIDECLERLPRNFAQSQAISLALAEFLCHSISILSRSFVFDQLKIYCQQMDQRIVYLQVMNPTLSAQLLSLKFAFIRTIYSHEHFIFLCLPFADLPKIEEKLVTQKPEESLKRSLTQLNRMRSVRRESGQMARGRGGFGQTQQQQTTKSQSSMHPPKQMELNATPESAPLFTDVCAEHSNRHFPVSLLLSQIQCLLLSSDFINSSAGAMAAIDLLHWLISAHENDWRLQDPELRQRMAQIYSPLLGIILELIGRREWTTIWMGKQRGNVDADSGLASSSEEGRSNGGGISSARNANGNGKEGTDERKLAGQKLLLSLCWLLRSLNSQSLLQHLRQFSSTQLCQFVLLLRSLISAFGQSPPAPQNRRNSADSFVHLNLLQIGPIMGDEFQQMFSLPSTTETTMLGIRRQSVETMFSDKCSDKMPTATEEKTAKRSTTMTGKSSGIATGEGIVKWRKKEEDVTAIEIERHISRHLSAEILLLVLDQIDFLYQIANTTRNATSTLLSDILRLFLHILGGNNALASFEHIFRSQRAFIRKFPDFLLNNSGNSSIGCSEQLLFTLCLQLLRHMGSEMADVRAQAGLTTFTLLRAGQKVSKSAFTRLSKTFTLALSSYVSSAAASGLTLNDAILRQSLEAILQFRDGNESASATKKESANWRTQLEELVTNLSAILVDSLKLEACGDDFEMAIDLMLRIAHGYRNNPQLRMAWLMAIARKNLSEERRNNAEAAQCLLHCCAIVADQLASSGAVDDEFLPHSVFQIFEQLSENVREEWAQGKAGRGIMEEKGTILKEQRIGGQFNLKAFGEMVEKAAKFFERAQLFELIPTVFKLVFPMHEQMHSNAKLIQLHSQIVDCLSRVGLTSLQQPILWEDKELANWENFCGFCPSGGDKRCFGTYFRVRFFGTLFGELDGQEFVYKEPAITKLAEISHRLEEFYANKFGGKNVIQVIKDSNEIDPKRLDPTKAHLQITYVEPHFERWERRHRQTHIQRNYRLKQFIFATPFTLDRKAHGPLQEQHKRKTVLTVENSFPYVKTRLRVIKREQWVLTPIEVALEDVQKRSRELGWAMAAKPIDVKMLQMMLQGCIGTTVNQGPLEIARVFLAGIPLDSDGIPREGAQRRLHLAFDELAQKCADALEMNGQLMEPSREDYQRELRRNMAHFQETMAQIRAQSAPQNGLSSVAPSPAELVQALALAGKIGPISTV